MSSFHPKPLAACLAVAVLCAPGFVRAGHAFDSARNDERGKPTWWVRPDPAEIASRWTPARHPIPSVPANALVVQNCNDSGSGSLREAVASATSGDTIDLTQLACSTITLTSGEIDVDQDDLSIQGPGAASLSISGNDAVSVLRHSGSGTLSVYDLSIVHGTKYLTEGVGLDAKGGCIYSAASVVLADAVIADCTARYTGSTYGAKGGAIFAYRSVSLSNSSVLDSSAISSGPDNGSGGGIYSLGSVGVFDSFVAGNYASYSAAGLFAADALRVKYSTIDSNNAGSVVGGLAAFGDITIASSTLSNNQAVSRYGAGFMHSQFATLAVTITNSTISGNSALAVGGLGLDTHDGLPGATIANSTIAFNHEGSASKYGAGLYLDGTVDLQSTIVSNNSYAGATLPDDIGGASGSAITGADDLIGYSGIPIPDDTIVMTDPILGPLAMNGGPTSTHALLSGSPAIDAGNDVAAASYDQRGPGYPRVIGTSTDIGAYEFDADAAIFADGFDP